jgi:hypothetical protein
MGEIDNAHASRPDLARDFVMCECFPDHGHESLRVRLAYMLSGDDSYLREVFAAIPAAHLAEGAAAHSLLWVACMSAARANSSHLPNAAASGSQFTGNS